MDSKTYIASGILELYVSGKLSEKENLEVDLMMQKHPEVLQEVLEIEQSILKLTASVATHTTNFNSIKEKIDTTQPRVVEFTSRRQSPWILYSGWAASLVLAGGLIWVLNNNNDLEQQINVTEVNNNTLERKIEAVNNDLVNTKTLLNSIRSKNVVPVLLDGQGNFQNSYAKVYWDKAEKTIYLDGQGLPKAPEGKVYQVWSLTLDPLTPVSLGTLDGFNNDETKLFEITNANESQAFGITLEPQGGSKTPTMDQLYTLGLVTATP